MVVQKISIMVSLIDAFTAPMTRFKKFYKEQVDGTLKMKKSYKATRRSVGRLAVGFRKAMHGMRGFKMEMLSVMFFGMGIQKFFKGLITPALQLVGVFDIFKTALAILFLPLAMKVLEWAMTFMDWVLNMSPTFQNLINWFAAIGYAVGTFLAIFGMAVLGIGGVIIAFGGIIAAILSAVVSIAGFIFSWKGLIVTILGIGLATTAVTAFGGAIEKTKGFISTLLDKFVQFSFVQDILDKLGIAGGTFSEVWASIVEKIKEKFIEIPEKIREKIQWIADFSYIIFRQYKARLGNLIDKFMELGGEDMKTNITSLAKSFETLISPLETINTTLGWISDRIAEFNQGKENLGNLWDYIFNPRKVIAKGSDQMGGYVPHTGLYKLHAGETVEQAGSSSSFSPNITVHAGSNVDIEMLKTQLSSQWNDELGRLSRR